MLRLQKDGEGKSLKRFICAILASLMCATAFFGCAKNEREDKVDIICTVFPIYDWVRNLLEGEEGVSLTLLVKNGTDPHSYVPTPSDIAKISSCDALIYVGGESDAWVSEVLRGGVNERMLALPLLELLDEREVVEAKLYNECDDGDCGEHSHRNDENGENHEGEEHHHGDGHEHAFEEHVWLSLKNARELCADISERLCELLPQSAPRIKERSARYIGEIEALDRQYESSIESAERKTLIFADRFPFGYLAADYSLDCFAAFSGCSADSEASFRTVAFLASTAEETGISYLLILDSSDGALARTVIESGSNKDIEVLVIDSLQSTTLSQIEAGASYIDIMESNLGVIKRALGRD